VLLVVLVMSWTWRDVTERAAPPRDTPAAGAEDAAVHFDPAAARVTTRGKPAAGVLVLAVSVDPGEPEELPGETAPEFLRAVPWGAWALTDENGRYEFPDASGEVHLLALAADGSYATTSFTPAGADLELREPSRRHGVVLRAEDGEPLAGAHVEADVTGRFGSIAGVRLRELLRDAVADADAAACVNATRARTTADGRFEISVGPAQSVVATAPGRDTDFADVNESSDEVGPLVLGPGGGVTGVVREPDGTPVPRALVELYPEGAFENGYGQMPAGHRATASDAEGRFEFAGLPDGVRYRAEAHHPQREVHAARVAVADGAPLDMVLRPWPRVEAYVDYGEWRGSVDCFGVSLAGKGLSEPVRLSVESGRFVSFPLNLPPGTYQLRLDAGIRWTPRWLDQCEVVLPETGAVTAHDLQVPDEVCVIRLRVGRFELRDVEFDVREGKELVTRLLTDARGIASIVPSLPASSFVVEVEGVNDPIPVHRGELVDLDLADRLGSRARVRLPELDAKEVQVEVIGHGNHEMGRRAVPPDRTLEFESRDRTAIRVAIAVEGRTPWIRSLGFTKWRDVECEAELPPLRHTGVHIVDEEGRGLAHVELELTDPSGIVAGHAETRTDAEGRTVLPVMPRSVLRLVDSPFVLMGHVTGRDLARVTTVTAARAGAIRGVCRYDGERQDGSLLLDLVEPRFPVSRIVETDHAGRFHVEALPPGRYRMRTFLSTHEWTLDVAAGRTTVVTLR
jgi:hypothetical protein